ncbi:hypothetical protein [Geobacter anodireducens]|nr:hypothetical protein [Geobacter soli]
MKVLIISALIIGTFLTSGCMMLMPGDHMGHHGARDESTESQTGSGGHSH